MKIKLYFCCLLFLSPILQAEETHTSVYSQIQDISHPTLDDYRLIQNYLTHGERADLKQMRDPEMEQRVRQFKMIGDTADETPQSGIIPVNTSLEEKENCILIYSSFNGIYPLLFQRLITLISNSDFKGHLFYRLGGWPNVEEGDLRLAHVPYAFKVCFFKEAIRLGYRRILWLDCSAVPLVSLNTIFEMIAKQGYFVVGNYHTVGRFMNAEAAAAFGLTLQQTSQIPSCSAGLFGVDYHNFLGTNIIDDWNQAAHHEKAFFSARSDQNALSIILYRMGISDFIPFRRVPYTRQRIEPDSLFLIDGQW